jgi:hypothetical protein
MSESYEYVKLTGDDLVSTFRRYYIDMHIMHAADLLLPARTQYLSTGRVDAAGLLCEPGEPKSDRITKQLGLDPSSLLLLGGSGYELPRDTATLLRCCIVARSDLRDAILRTHVFVVDAETWVLFLALNCRKALPIIALAREFAAYTEIVLDPPGQATSQTHRRTDAVFCPWSSRLRV